MEERDLPEPVIGQDISPIRSTKLYDFYHAFEEGWQRTAYPNRQPDQIMVRTRSQFAFWIRNASDSDVHEQMRTWGMTPAQRMEDLTRIAEEELAYLQKLAS